MSIYCKHCHYELLSGTELVRPLPLCDECWDKINLSRRREMLKIAWNKRKEDKEI